MTIDPKTVYAKKRLIWYKKRPVSIRAVLSSA